MLLFYVEIIQFFYVDWEKGKKRMEKLFHCRLISNSLSKITFE